MISNELGKITILVNSCDAYSDLWDPFFTLLKRYWNICDIPVILNTESIDYQFEGVSIKCVHPTNVKAPYGERMLHALKHIKTEYVISFLDDFFIREPVDVDQIINIIRWMDADTDIAYFNCDCTPTYCDLEKDKYQGYKRLPLGNEYILNMQAAIWRTDLFKRFWKPNVSPWDWEQICNLSAAQTNKYKFYCSLSPEHGFCYYGRGKFGVSKGKWMSRNDIIPLFEKEKISMDFTKRGFLDDCVTDNKVEQAENTLKENAETHVNFFDMLLGQMAIINRCIPENKLDYIIYVIWNILRRERKYSVSAYVDDKLLLLRKE